MYYKGGRSPSRPSSDWSPTPPSTKAWLCNREWPHAPATSANCSLTFLKESNLASSNCPPSQPRIARRDIESTSTDWEPTTRANYWTDSPTAMGFYSSIMEISLRGNSSMEIVRDRDVSSKPMAVCTRVIFETEWLMAMGVTRTFRGMLTRGSGRTTCLMARGQPTT